MTATATATANVTVLVIVTVAVLACIIIYQGVASYLDRLRHDHVVKQLTAALLAKNAAEYKELMVDQKLDLRRLKIENDLAMEAAKLERTMVDQAGESNGPHVPVT